MHQIAKEAGNVIRVDVSGKLTQADYDKLIPSWEAMIARQGKLRMLIVMRDFHGWDPKAAWDDFRFGVTHEQEVERIALVGEKEWQHWMTKIASWFFAAGVRYFSLSQLNEAEQWIRQA